MTTFRDDRRYNDHETFKRDPGPEFSPEALAAQRAALERAGGKTQVIPFGKTSEYKTNPLRPDRPKPKNKIRTEDYA